MAGNKRWTKRETDYLAHNYNGGDIGAVAAYLKRSKASIHKKASDLGISFSFDERTEVMKILSTLKDDINELRKEIASLKKPKKDSWSKEYDDIIIKNYKLKSDKEIAKMIGVSTPVAVYRRQMLGLEKRATNTYTSLMKSKHDDIEKLIINGKTYSYIASHLFSNTGIKRDNIANYVHANGIKKTRLKRYTQREIDYILKWYPHKTAKEIAFENGLNLGSLKQKIIELIESGKLKSKYQKKTNID